MDSSRRWRKVWRWIGARMYRTDSIEAVLSRTGDRYIDIEGWCQIQGVTEDAAREQLALGVALGHFERLFLYEWDDSPIPFVVPEDYLDRTIQLREVGYVGEDDEEEIHLARTRVREVFVAREHHDAL